MHQSFTGNARKSRQVNLSRGQVGNPWGQGFGLPKTTSTSVAGQSTVAQAQAERLKRQNERIQRTAIERLQRYWRGHASRRRQKHLWRQMWDAQEQNRNNGTKIQYEKTLDPAFEVPAYESLELFLSQLRLLNRFQEFRKGLVRDERDTLRLMFFSNSLKHCEGILRPAINNRSLISNLLKLVHSVSRHIESTILSSKDTTMEQVLIQLTQTLISVAKLIPGHCTSLTYSFIRSARIILEHTRGAGTLLAAVNVIVVLLELDVADSSQLYVTLLSELLSTRSLSETVWVLDMLIDHLEPKILTRSVIENHLLHENLTATARVSQEDRIWQLSYLVYIYRKFQQSRPDLDQWVKVIPAWVQMISVLLSQCANEIAERNEIEDYPMTNDSSVVPLPLHSFVRENLSYLTQQSQVRDFVRALTEASGPGVRISEATDFHNARHLAIYALGMFRAFPRKATDVRLWLYQGTMLSYGGTKISTIQYFWRNVKGNDVYKKISRSHRNVMSSLTEPMPVSNQIAQPPVTVVDIENWKDQWQIILLFLELYSFVLRLMDDEEFFALEQANKFAANEERSNIQNKGSLPLQEVASLSTFLKNLAFTLYWNASDLVETNESEDANRISALFGNIASENTGILHSKRPKTITGNGISQIYLKGLVTGLLRMLHERDSRRRFLPPNHWLMTSQVDMTGFIPAVVAEEQKRHEIGVDDIDEEDSLIEIPSPSETPQSLDVLSPRQHFFPRARGTTSSTTRSGPNTGVPVGQDGDTDQLDQNIDFSTSRMRSLFGIRAPHTSVSTSGHYAEELQRRREQAKKMRKLESLVPRLEILRNLPFFIPFETRVQIFREFIYNDQMLRRNGHVDPDIWRLSVANSLQGRGPDGRPLGFGLLGRHHAEIHRESVFEDAYGSFYQLGEAIKEPIQISFIDKFGAPEAGIDGGGVTKEFLMSVTSEALDPNGSFNMFQENEQRFLYPNPLVFDETAEYLMRAGVKQGSENFSYQMREFLRRFEFVGRIVGKCLYEGILIDVNFAGFFLLKWALTGGTTSASTETAYRATINDVREFDEELYQGLLKLKKYTGDVESDFSLNFTITDTVHLSGDNGEEVVHTIERELIHNGSNIPVTNVNRLAYIDRVVRYRLQQQPQLVTNAFLKGLGQIIQPMWLAMFNQKELQNLVGGDNTELDIIDLRRNTQYGGLYVIGDDGLEHPTIELFWKVLKEMNDGDRRKVLKFVTSAPRAPLLGFSYLNPKFSIRDSSEDQDRLPSTSTCVNLLKLPRYGDVKTMREKLLYAVNSGAGFDLS